MCAWCAARATFPPDCTPAHNVGWKSEPSDGVTSHARDLPPGKEQLRLSIGGRSEWVLLSSLSLSHHYCSLHLSCVHHTKIFPNSRSRGRDSMRWAEGADSESAARDRGHDGERGRENTRRDTTTQKREKRRRRSKQSDENAAPTRTYI